MRDDIRQSIFNGRRLSVKVFGASHAPEIGVEVKGFNGEKVDTDRLEEFMERRRAKKTAYSTKRLEADKVVIENGLENEKLQPFFRAVIKNGEQRSSDYSNLIKTPRPSHADYVAFTTYGDDYDYRGGGKFSGRLTAPMCIAGGLCKQILEQKGIKINAFISRIGSVKAKGYESVSEESELNFSDPFFPVLEEDKRLEMLKEIESAGSDCDSVGGIIDCVVTGVPVGCGEYMFDSLESVISQLVFAVPAVKGIEFGKGFGFASIRGSEANDPFYYDDSGKVKTKTNNNGGINGGLSNGMPITFRVVIKPTPSIAKEQDTVDLQKKENAKLKITGRHDACITPRAVPVIEAVTSIAIYDSLGE